MSWNRTLQERVIDHSVELIQAADELKMEREQRQSTEEREQEVRDRLREVMHRSPFPMWTYDLNKLALLEVNNAAVALHGSSREELSKMCITDLYPQEEVYEWGKVVASSVAPGDSPKVWRHRVKDGSVIPVAVLARPVEWQGRNAALVVVVNEREGHRLQDMTITMGAAVSGI
ncbi:MAG: PAS domain S-box protein [Terriglobia bacterium]